MGADFYPIPIRQGDLADHFHDAILQSETFCINAHGVEKYVLREAVRDVITDTIYRRQKHPFLSPPATLNPTEKLSTLVQDTLRGTVMGSIPFFDQKKVQCLLDRLPEMDESSQVAVDPVLMTLLSACVLQEGFRLSA